MSYCNMSILQISKHISVGFVNRQSLLLSRNSVLISNSKLKLRCSKSSLFSLWSQSQQYIFGALYINAAEIHILVNELASFSRYFFCMHSIAEVCIELLMQSQFCLFNIELRWNSWFAYKSSIVESLLKFQHLFDLFFFHFL